MNCLTVTATQQNV